MPAFEYRYLDTNGRQKKGVQQADSPRQIRQQLMDKGFIPLQVDQTEDKSSTTSTFSLFSSAGKLQPAELALITRQLATLIRSGLPIEQALTAVARQAGKQRVERIVLAVRARLTEGYSLAQSLAEFPRAFNELYRATVAAGEQSGHLEQVLDQLAEYLETRHDTGRSVKQAMAYPAFIMVFSVIIIGFLMAFVVPKMVAMFAGRAQELPVLTQVMIWLSEFTQNWWWLMLMLFIAGAFAFAKAMKQDAFKLQVHQTLLRVPFLGNVLRVSESARLASTLGILGRSGVPLVEGLAISSQVVTNLEVRAAVREATTRVREGGSLSKALEASGHFPPMLVQMIASGEASGELDQMLTRAADYQERDLNATLQTTVSLLGPMMLLIMAGFVILVVMSVVMPMMELNTIGLG